MTDTKIINSDSYWNARFSENWEACQGPNQSRFFSRIAIQHLPQWLIDQIKQQSLTLADWGCAQGDGTEVWASCIDAQQIAGIDFSPVAIEQATKRYPAIRFINEDWLAKSGDNCEVFDVLFSSNTLEHFHQPYDVLRSICMRAKKAIVLALPYREMERIDEHFFSFLPESTPLQLPNGFRLVWSKVIDCRQLPNTLWNGEQVILVYADTNWVDSLGLNLVDCRIEQDDTITAVSRLNAVVTKRDEQIASLNQVIVDRDNELKRLSDWAHSIDQRPFTHAFKKYSRKLARAVYHSLPLRLEHKERLKTIARRVIKRLHNSDGEAAPVFFDESRPVPKLLQALACGAPITGRDVFVFSVIDWHFRIQRPQHLARCLAKAGHRVFFFSNHFVDSAKPGYQIERLDPELELYQVKLHVTGAPAIYFAPPTKDAMEMLERGVAKLILDFAAVSSTSLIQHAYWYPLVCSLPNTLRVYDCMDHHEGFGNVPEKLISIEKTMLRESDLVIVTSSWLDQFARDHNRNVALIRNAGEYSHFSRQPAECYADASGRKIIGYYGAIAEWFDLDLIRAVAEAHPDALILLVGNDTVDAAKKLKDLQNVVFTGEVPYAQLPYYLYAFDVCLLPFQVIPLTLATNPVKVYEYLAAGKPVVSVDLPEISQFGDLVHRAHSTDDFIRLVTQSIATPPSEPEIKLCQAFASEQTWEHRVTALCQAIDCIPLPKISVIVLTYNNLDLTKACLESLLRWSNYPNIEIIVVDNASTDGSPQYLRELKREHDEINLILNEQNLGFAAGNNVGLKVATGDYLVLLNNDTVVTPGWLLTMARHLQANGDIGLIGPVTNNIGNEAKINIAYKSTAEMLPQALARTTLHMGQRIPLRTAAFFCVMMPRSVYEQVGLLDENFGRGFFEDDDYCRRVEQLGLRIACAEDVFVHHHLSASFNKLHSGEKQALFEQNRAYYESKWGKWNPHMRR